jgi:hypothetical protein
MRNFLLIFLLLVFQSSLSTLHAVPNLEVRQELEQTSVLTGEELRGSIFIKNSGDEPLKIRGISSSCGCTTLRLKKRLVLPEEEVELRFVVDTRGKLGLIEKTVTLHTNTTDSPHTETIKFHALPSGMDGADTQAVFEPPCAACHLDSGIGKSGKELYKAVCGMCHPDLKIHTNIPAALQTMIFSGNAQIGMPAFGEFLTKNQIHSLIQILSKNKD